MQKVGKQLFFTFSTCVISLCSTGRHHLIRAFLQQFACSSQSKRGIAIRLVQTLLTLSWILISTCTYGTIFYVCRNEDTPYIVFGIVSCITTDCTQLACVG